MDDIPSTEWSSCCNPLKQSGGSLLDGRPGPLQKGPPCLSVKIQVAFGIPGIFWLSYLEDSVKVQERKPWESEIVTKIQMQLGTITREKIQFLCWSVSPSQTRWWWWSGGNLREEHNSETSEDLAKSNSRLSFQFRGQMPSVQTTFTLDSIVADSPTDVCRHKTTKQVFNSAQLGGESDCRDFPEMDEISRTSMFYLGI